MINRILRTEGLAGDRARGAKDHSEKVRGDQLELTEILVMRISDTRPGLEIGRASLKNTRILARGRDQMEEEDQANFPRKKKSPDQTESKPDLDLKTRVLIVKGSEKNLNRLLSRKNHGKNFRGGCGPVKDPDLIKNSKRQQNYQLKITLIITKNIQIMKTLKQTRRKTTEVRRSRTQIRRRVIPGVLAENRKNKMIEDQTHCWPDPADLPCFPE